MSLFDEESEVWLTDIFRMNYNDSKKAFAKKDDRE